MANERRPQYEFFSKRFKEAYKSWRKRTGGTQEKLAELIEVSDRRSISDWMNAKSYPTPANMKKLCEVLEVTEDSLTRSYENDYHYSENFTEELHRKQKAFCKGIDLDLSFLKYIHEAVPDEDFPIYSPLMPKTGKLLPDEDGFSIGYTRQDDFLTAYRCEEENEFQRQIGDGKTVNLHYADLAFIKDVQEEVTNYVLYLMYKRKKEMEQELSDLTEASTDRTKGLRVQFSAQKIAEYDHYSKYIYKETIDQIIKVKEHDK